MGESDIILVVDDDPDLLSGVARLLRREGYTVLEAATAAQARDLAKAHRPDLILLDVVLPDRPGTDLCAELKADPDLAGTLIILVSGVRTQSEDQALGLVAGADGYIARPIPNKELLARIQAILRARGIERALSKALEELRAAHDQQVLLGEMTASFNAARSVEQVLETLCDSVQRLGYPYGIVWEASQGDLIWSGHSTLPDEAIQLVEQMAEALGMLPEELDVRVSINAPNPISACYRTGAMQRGTLDDLLLGIEVNDQAMDQLGPQMWQAARGVMAAMGLEDYAVLSMSAYGVIFLGTPPGWRATPDGQAVMAAIDEATIAIERQQAQEALQDREQRYRALVETAIVGIAVVSDDETIVWSNPAFAKTLGYQVSELVGTNLSSLTPPEVFATYPALTEQRKQGITSTFETQLWRKDGALRDLLIHASPLFQPNGSFLGTMAVILDITKRKQAQAAALHMARLEATATLAGGIAHDVNNLMAGVVGYAELLQQALRVLPDPTRRDAHDMLGDIITSAQRASNLAQQLLAYARGGKYVVRPLILNDIVRETVRQSAPNVPAAVRLNTHLDPGLWRIEADAAQMKQMVLSLLTNARETLAGQGDINISTQNVTLDQGVAPEGLSPGRYVQLAVQDTGQGMSEETLAHLFEPFRTTKAFGRGLGLAAAYGIAKNHDGHIWAETALGQGSTFRLLLPALGEAEPTPAQVTRPAHGPEAEDGKKPLVMVVDNEPAVRNVTRRMLERFGYRALTAHDGDDALRMVQEHPEPIHLVIMDMSTSQADGFQLFAALRALIPKARILLCSDYDLDPALQALLDQGAMGILNKPFDMASLRQAVEGALAD